MDKAASRITAVLGLLCCLLAGCASPERYVDESRAWVRVVRGYIEAGTLHRWELCELEFAVCGAGLPSDVTFVVEEALVGAGKRRPRAYFSYTLVWPELKLGRESQYLAVILSDGRTNELRGVVPVARTTDGKWAVPITVDEDSDLLPCSKEDPPPARLQFEPSGARESLVELEYDERDVWRLKEDDSYTVKDGYVYANKGVSLDRVAAVYAGKSVASVAKACAY